MAIRSYPRFLHPLGSFRTPGFSQYDLKPASYLCLLPKPAQASFDAEPAVLSVSGSESRRLGPLLYPQALGSARLIIPAPPNAITALSASLTNSVQLGFISLRWPVFALVGRFASPALLCFVVLLVCACRDLYPVG
jgi:hypothetical protein